MDVSTPARNFFSVYLSIVDGQIAFGVGRKIWSRGAFESLCI